MQRFCENQPPNLALGGKMYRKTDKDQPNFVEFEKFHLPFGGKLSPNNRWVIKAKCIPWNDIEESYSKNFSDKMGAPGISARIAIGALIIKETCRYTDEETVEQIRENPYLQYFLGFCEYCYKIPFDASMMTHFRKRITAEIMQEINEKISKVKENKNKDNDSDDPDDKNGYNKGKLIVDATCAPSDIRFPTDISLLNEAREKTEKIIDIFYEKLEIDIKKPRTYRKKARKDFLNAIKKKKKTANELRKHIGKQLRYLNRNLKYIKNMLEKSEENLLIFLSRKDYKDLLVIHEVFRQQKEMYDLRKNHIENRIVSINQAHVRPIVRGKPSAMTEFGAKISLSVVKGYTFVDHICWNNFNEGNDLKDQIEKYRIRFGFYPESIHADKKYQTINNRKYCEERGIRFTGSKLGRPNVDKSIRKKLRKQMIKDAIYRIRIEGKIGVVKRKYGLSKIMAKLQKTCEIVILMNILVMNLGMRTKKNLQAFFWLLENFRWRLLFQ